MGDGEGPFDVDVDIIESCQGSIARQIDDHTSDDRRVRSGLVHSGDRIKEQSLEAVGSEAGNDLFAKQFIILAVQRHRSTNDKFF